MRRLFPRLRPAPLLAVAFVVGVVVVGRWTAGDSPGTPRSGVVPARPDRATSQPNQSTVALQPLAVTVEAVEVRSPGGTVQTLPEDVQTAVVQTLQHYLTASTLDPLRPPSVQRAEPPTVTLESLFTESTRPRLAGPDRRALVDEGLGPAVGGVSVEQAIVRLSALAREDGTVALVTAVLDARFTAHTADGSLLIVRTGELVFAPEGDGWKIDAYRLSARRELGADAAAEAGF